MVCDLDGHRIKIWRNLKIFIFFIYKEQIFGESDTLRQSRRSFLILRRERERHTHTQESDISTKKYYGSNIVYGKKYVSK